jgi:hypothetical protein
MGLWSQEVRWEGKGWGRARRNEVVLTDSIR